MRDFKIVVQKNVQVGEECATLFCVQKIPFQPTKEYVYTFGEIRIVPQMITWQHDKNYFVIDDLPMLFQAKDSPYSFKQLVGLLMDVGWLSEEACERKLRERDNWL